MAKGGKKASKQEGKAEKKASKQQDGQGEKEQAKVDRVMRGLASVVGLDGDASAFEVSWRSTLPAGWSSGSAGPTLLALGAEQALLTLAAPQLP